MSEHRTPYQDEVTYGARRVPFVVVPAARATLGIRVHPDGRVEVRAPHGADVDDVRERVARRARWITRQQRQFAAMALPEAEKDYTSGETHYYLGGQYRLMRVQVAARVDEGVRLVGRYFEVRIQAPPEGATPEARKEIEVQTAGRVRTLLDAWYGQAARKHLRRRFEQGVLLMSAYGVEEPTLEVRKMRRRWGSCTPHGRVLLNPRLVVAPTYCIDYVVLHELCHVVYPHHGRAFYRLLDRVMPDWPRRKARLAEV